MIGLLYAELMTILAPGESITREQIAEIYQRIINPEKE